METPSSDHLGIAITNTGAANIKRLIRTTRLLLWIGSACTGLLLADALLRQSYLAPERYRASNLLLYLTIRYHLAYVTIYAFFFLFQLYYFLRFVRMAARSIDLLDTDGFNESFDYIYKGNVMAIINLSLSMLIGGLTIVMDYQFYTVAKSLNQ